MWRVRCQPSQLRQRYAIGRAADLLRSRPALVLRVWQPIAGGDILAWSGTTAKMINSVMRGVFLKDSALRREFLALIPGKN